MLICSCKRGCICFEQAIADKVLEYLLRYFGGGARLEALSTEGQGRQGFELVAQLYPLEH